MFPGNRKVRAGTQKQEQRQESQIDNTFGLHSFLIQPRNMYLEVIPLTVGQALPHQSIIKKMLSGEKYIAQ